MLNEPTGHRPMMQLATGAQARDIPLSPLSAKQVQFELTRVGAVAKSIIGPPMRNIPTTPAPVQWLDSVQARKNAIRAKGGSTSMFGRVQFGHVGVAGWPTPAQTLRNALAKACDTMEFVQAEELAVSVIGSARKTELAPLELEVKSSPDRTNSFVCVG